MHTDEPSPSEYPPPDVPIGVRSRIAKDDLVHLRLEDGGRLPMRRFVPVGKGDTLVRRGSELYAILQDGSELPLSPAWRSPATLQIGAEEASVVIKEIETAAEFEGYKRLTEYHYRGGGGAGRRAPLVAVLDSWELPQVVGFIEVTSGFLVNTARTRIFDARFEDPSRGVGWPHWNRESAKKNANCVARISRCVVFPELRGVGLSKLLVDAAVDFARERWQIARSKPLFLEITADMLRYWPFVEGSDFVYVGETEGNEKRAVKDMRYLLQKSEKAGGIGTKGMPQKGGGIMSMQRAYAVKLGEVRRRRGMTVDQIVTMLRTSPEELTDEEWVSLHRIYRRPKPTYMRGLTDAAQAFLKKRQGAIPGHLLRRHRRTELKKPFPRGELLSVEGLSLSVTAKPQSSGRARKVQEAFGIVAVQFEMKLIRHLTLKFAAGEVILVGGPSGTGKSLLLRALFGFATGKRPDLPAEVSVEGQVSKLDSLRVATLRKPAPEISPIDALESHPLEKALQILASAGLAEPQLFVRPARTLSMGQSYRLALALALAQSPAVLLIDEFCEPLDRFSTAAVCRRLRAAARRTGLAVIAATASPGRVIPALRPDRVILLASDGSASIREPSATDRTGEDDAAH